jgi:mannose-6-phosphate isomerase-like protein (cupin superfamily)
MEFKLSPDTTKKEIFEKVASFLTQNNFRIVNYDDTRPWGGFYVIDETQSKLFIDYFFKNVPKAKQHSNEKVSPKLLIVESKKRLSWQYHQRRSEVWKVIAGEVGVIISDTNKETEIQLKKKGDLIILKQGERHRLIGLEGWGIIAEIWKHTAASHPSDEDDIIRVQDDFGR